MAARSFDSSSCVPSCVVAAVDDDVIIIITHADMVSSERLCMAYKRAGLASHSLSPAERRCPWLAAVCMCVCVRILFFASCCYFNLIWVSAVGCRPRLMCAYSFIYWNYQLIWRYVRESRSECIAFLFAVQPLNETNEKKLLIPHFLTTNMQSTEHALQQ